MKKTVHAMVMAANVSLSGLTSAEEVTQISPEVEKSEMSAFEVKKDEMYALMEERGYRCLECHDVDKKVVGPAWKEVAAKRKGHRWASELITFKISSGSVGEYDMVKMPHNEVREEDARLIANWILSLWSSNP